MSNIEVNDGAVLKDGENIGTVVEGAFVPVDGLHHQTVKAVDNHLASLEDGEETEKPKKAKASKQEPTPDPERGDLDHKLIAHREENWDEARFNELYPEARLKAAGYR